MEELVVPPVKGSREDFELKFKKASFYWTFLQIIAEIELEQLEILRSIEKKLK